MLIGFGLGVLAVRYFPQVANPLGIPHVDSGHDSIADCSQGLLPVIEGDGELVQLLPNGLLLPSRTISRAEC
jgi:hypothetical protein